MSLGFLSTHCQWILGWMLKVVPELGFGKLLDKTFLIDCPLICALGAPCFLMILMIFCLPLHMQVMGRTSKAVLELDRH